MLNIDWNILLSYLLRWLNDPNWILVSDTRWRHCSLSWAASCMLIGPSSSNGSLTNMSFQRYLGRPTDLPQGRYSHGRALYRPVFLHQCGPASGAWALVSLIILCSATSFQPRSSGFSSCHFPFPPAPKSSAISSPPLARACFPHQRELPSFKAVH